MSYRLIDANSLAVNYRQVNDMPCIYADLPNGLDGGYYDLARGSEECELEETETLENVTAHVLECSECGRTCEHVNGDYPRCPYCGRKVKQRTTRWKSRTFGKSNDNLLSYYPDDRPEDNIFLIKMTRGGHRIANVIHQQFGGFNLVVIDVDGEQHEFDADSLIRMLEDYESYGQVPEQGERGNDGVRESCESNYEKLFGTPERAAETMFTLMLNCARGNGPCERCPAFPRCNWASDDGEETESMMLEWLRGDA